MKLTTQQKRIVRALQLGLELTTASCAEKLGIFTLSQRAGELERLGLVRRDHPEVLNRDGKKVKVVRASLTDAGRALQQ